MVEKERGRVGQLFGVKRCKAFPNRIRREQNSFRNYQNSSNTWRMNSTGCRQNAGQGLSLSPQGSPALRALQLRLRLGLILLSDGMTIYGVL